MLGKRICFSKAGLAKKSFALPFGGCFIWCEHLDSLGNEEAVFRQKLLADAFLMARPSAPSLVAVSLDETAVAQAQCDLLTDVLRHQAHPQKTAFVGISLWEKRRLQKALRGSGTEAIFSFWNDLEQGKEWLMT